MSPCVTGKACVAKSCLWTCCGLFTCPICILMANSILIIVGLFNYSTLSDSNDCAVLSILTRSDNGNSPLILSHRGFIDEYPENTMESVTASYDIRIPAEIDILLTSDNIPVLGHDDHLLESTGEDIYISETEWNALSQLEYLDTINGVTYNDTTNIARLSDVLDEICTQYDSKFLFLDLKGVSQSVLLSDGDEVIVEQTINVIAESPCANQSEFVFFIASFNVAVLDYAKQEWNGNADVSA